MILTSPGSMGKTCEAAKRATKPRAAPTPARADSFKGAMSACVGGFVGGREICATRAITARFLALSPRYEEHAEWTCNAARITREANRDMFWCKEEDITSYL